MDLATIKMHLDNFVDTWQGWNKIFAGLTSSVYGEKATFSSVLDGTLGAFDGIFALSSK